MCNVTCHVTLYVRCHITCHVTCHITCHVMSCHVTSCHVMSRHVMSRHIMSWQPCKLFLGSLWATKQNICSISLLLLLSYPWLMATESCKNLLSPLSWRGTFLVSGEHFYKYGCFLHLFYFVAIYALLGTLKLFWKIFTNFWEHCKHF